MDPHYDSFKSSGESDVRAFFTRNASEISDALLGIVDRRAERAKHRTLKKAYYKLRPQGKKHTMEAMPRVASMVERNVS